MILGPATLVAIYLVCWWTVLFAVLPLGMNQGDQRPSEDGGQWGAPAEPRLKKKAITTTWIAALIWLAVVAIVEFGLIELPALPGSQN